MINRAKFTDKINRETPSSLGSAILTLTNALQNLQPHLQAYALIKCTTDFLDQSGLKMADIYEVVNNINNCKSAGGYAMGGSKYIQSQITEKL